MDLFTYLLKKKGHNSSVNGDLFSYLLASRKRGTYQTYNGTQINVIDSVNSRMKNWILGGNSNQNGTPTPDAPIDIHNVIGENNILENEGKNLLNPASIDQITRSGIKCTYNADTQEITFNGTCNADNTGFHFLNEIVEAIQGVTTASVHYVSGSVTGYCNFRAFTQNYGGNINFNINDLSNNNKIDYVTSNYNEKLSKISFRFNAGAIADNFKVKVMIANTTNTEYEKYKGRNYKVSLTTNMTIPENEHIYITGLGLTYGIGVSDEGVAIPIKQNTSYKVSVDTTMSRYRVGTTTNYSSSGGNLNNGVVKDNTNEDIIINNSNDNYLIINVSDLSKLVVAEFTIELCKIGDYQDKIYKSNDKWLLEKNVEKYVLNGTQNITYSTIQGTTFLAQINIGLGNLKPNEMISNLLPYRENNWNTQLETIGIGGVNNNLLQIILNNNRLESSNATGFNKFISENNIIVYLQLKTPVITEITDDNLINQLEELAKARSFENQTNISQLSEQLPFDLTVDIKTL